MIKYFSVRPSVLLLLAGGIALGQLPPDQQDVSKKQLEDAYAEHDTKIRKLLPPYSGPPLLQDISHLPLEDGLCDPEQHVAWENRFNGIMGSELKVADKGIHPPDITMTSFTTTDTFAPIYSLPANGSDEIVIARAIAGRVCVPQSRRYVYTKFTLDVVKHYRKTPERGEQDDPHKQRQITAAQFGGTSSSHRGFSRHIYATTRDSLRSGRSISFSCGNRLPLTTSW
jgi:hypothetical protein